jgi:RNA polymerase sigma-70 factor (ECF subfamily)
MDRAMDAPQRTGSGPGDPAAALVPAVLAGDAAALDSWYRTEHPRVWRLCLGFLADPAEADDLAQDAMLHLLDHMAGWDRARGWEGWRNAVVLNLCRDRLRRAGALARAEERGAADRPERVLPHPARAAERAETRAALAAALAALPLREREAFVLRELEGFSTLEVARAMDVGESSVRSLLTLARRRLRELLAPHLADAAAEGGARG